MTFDYSVSFEYQEAPPDTVKGQVIAATAVTAAARAVKAARVQLPNKRPSSLVIVLEVE